MKRKYLARSILSASLIASVPMASSAGDWSNWGNWGRSDDDDEKKVYIMHTGDLHGPGQPVTYL